MAQQVTKYGIPVAVGAIENAAGEVVNWADAIGNPTAFSSMNIKFDRVDYSPSIFFGDYVRTNVKTGAAVLGKQVSFNAALFKPTRMVFLSSIAVTLTFVLAGSVWSASENRFTTLIPGGSFTIPAATQMVLNTNAVGLLIETTAALTTGQYIQIYAEGTKI